MSVNYSDVQLDFAGAHWRGKILAGVSGIPELCIDLDNSGVALCKDRPKIKAGCINGFFIKRYNMPGFITQFRRRFKTPRPFKALAGAMQLAKLGIPTPEVIAALVENRRLIRREYLVTAQLSENTVGMKKFFEETSDPEALWPRLAEGVIPQLCKLHDSGWIHGDLNMRNIFYDRAADAYGFIDLDGMKQYGNSLPMTHRCREIARLLSSYMIILRCIDRRDEFIRRAADAYGDGKNFLNTSAIANSMKPMLKRGKKYL